MGFSVTPKKGRDFSPQANPFVRVPIVFFFSAVVNGSGAHLVGVGCTTQLRASEIRIIKSFNTNCQSCLTSTQTNLWKFITAPRKNFPSNLFGEVFRKKSARHHRGAPPETCKTHPSRPWRSSEKKKSGSESPSKPRQGPTFGGKERPPRNWRICLCTAGMSFHLLSFVFSEWIISVFF